MADKRCTLRAKASGADIVFGPNEESNVLFPLRRERKLVFPYTPTVQAGNVAEYDEYSVTQSAFKYPSYVKSYPKDITVSADFTAQTIPEARYLLAAMHFFKAITKPYFGSSNPRAGTPPAIVLFNYLGQYHFNDVPVIVKDYSYMLEPNVDYVYIEDRDSYVPTKMSISLALETYYNPRLIRDEFDLDKFTSGEMYRGGYGGFI